MILPRFSTITTAWAITALAACLLGSPTPGHGQPPAVSDHGVVLMYHHFGENRYPATNIRLEAFDAQLDHLAQNGYRIWPLTRLVEHLKHQKAIPDKVVSITVDDAYISVYREAYPRLQARGWPFTVFVATDGVDRKFTALMTWKQMREMADNGVTFANHGASHDHLTERRSGEDEDAWAARVKADIQTGQQRLREELGRAPMLFAYPYGEYDLALARLVGTLGYTAFGQHSGAVGRDSEPTALPRFPVSEHHASGDNYHMKVASLPLPVTALAPRGVALKETGNPPTLTLTVPPDRVKLTRINCFASDQGEVPVTWLDRKDQRLSVTAPAPFSGPRSRYNCTAPSPFPGRYYWYSHPWFQ